MALSLVPTKLDTIPGPVLALIHRGFLVFENGLKNPNHLLFHWESSWPCSTLKIIGEYMVSKHLRLCARSGGYSEGSWPSSLLFLLPQLLKTASDVPSTRQCCGCSLGSSISLSMLSDCAKLPTFSCSTQVRKISIPTSAKNCK